MRDRRRVAAPGGLAGRASESDLLLACAVWDAGPAELALVHLRSRAVREWGWFLELARLHRLIPHAQRALLDAGAHVPAEIAAELRSETVAIAAAAMARTAQLAELVRLLGESGVRTLPFKGPTLSLAAYGNVGVRDSVDLDLVVLPRDVDRARDAMRTGGYRSRTSMSPAQERMLQRSFGHFAYARPGSPAAAELHWRFSARRYPWSLPPHDVLTRAGRIVLAGTAIAVADPADELLLQAMHGARHQWERLEWLVAFRRLLDADAFDHAALVERARAAGSWRALALALRLARDLLGARLPDDLAAIAAAEAAAAPAHEVARAIVRSLEQGVVPLDQPYRLNLRMMERTRDRVRYLALSVFAPTMREWEMVRLPDALLAFYYPLRVLRVLARRLRSAFVRR